jgi:16S rRNA (guanine(966)-N(2))-methyltransferase RsmD
MRIISGTHKGRPFNPPKGFRSRPTTDMAREGLFNILANTYNIHGLKVIDLFAGAGGISYEFASRGAEQVLSVEKNFQVFKHLCKESKLLGLPVIHFIKKDVFSWLAHSDEQADIIFADPPFDHPRIADLPGLILNNEKLLPGGCLIVEHPDGIQFDSFKEYKNTKTYGSVNFSFFFVD